MAQTIHHRLTLNEARRAKARLFASLEPRDLELLLALECRNPRTTIFGGPGDRQGHVVISVERTIVKFDSIGRRRSRCESSWERPQDQRRVNALVAAGWLRFARMSPEGEKALGYYWLTDSACKVLRACREGKQPLIGSAQEEK
jgi:hypothetical protein